MTADAGLHPWRIEFDDGFDPKLLRQFEIIDGGDQTTMRCQVAVPPLSSVSAEIDREAKRVRFRWSKDPAPAAGLKTLLSARSVRLVDLIFSRRDRTLVLEPILADAQAEIRDAEERGAVWEARWVQLRTCWDVAHALPLSRLLNLLRTAAGFFES